MPDRTPQEGGRCKEGPFDGRVLAYDSVVMPVYDNSHKRIGSYIWDEDHWEYDDVPNDIVEIYP